jgi:hypothetical protein
VVGIARLHALIGGSSATRLLRPIGEYFPAALEAFDDLDAVDAPDLLGKAPDPTSMPSSCSVRRPTQPRRRD